MPDCRGAARIPKGLTMKQQSTAIASSLPSSRDRSLSEWEAVMRKAVATMRETGIAAAAADCDTALAIARRVIDTPPPGREEDCIAALVVSHHNLADVKMACGEFDAAAGLLCQAHEALAATLQDAGRSTSIRQAALRHMRETRYALVAHVGAHGPHPLIARALCSGVLALDADDPTRH